MLAAARKGDQIMHTRQRGGLLGGMLVGALVGAALVAGTIATVLTGGLALGPILLIAGAVCTGAAVGGGIGRLIGGEMKVPKGPIITGAATVFINSLGKPAARACTDRADCDDHSPPQLIATGSTTVFIEGFPAARTTDIGECSFEVGKGSPDVFIGGERGQCAGVEIKPEVEGWLETFHHAVGLVGALCLLGPAFGARVALVSIFGGELGGRLGGELGAKYGGKWGGVFGSLVGGLIGGGIPLNPRAASVINRLSANPNALGSNFGNVRLQPQGSIRYGALDELGRPTGVRATITRDMIGTGTHANPAIEPPGWSGNGTLNNEARGHLLGRQLGGSGDDARNLVTLQQNPANSPAMSGFEGQVRRAVEGGQTVEYSSTPIYNGTNPVPRGVTLNGRGDGGFNLDVTVLNPPGR